MSRPQRKVIDKDDFRPELAAELQAIAEQSFEDTYIDSSWGCPLMDAMKLLKDWCFHTNRMDNLLRKTKFNTHDDLYNRKSVYLNILYNAFLTICERRHLSGAKEIDLSVFKSKMNCARSQKRNNMTIEEKKDRIMLATVANFKDYFLRYQAIYLKDKKVRKRDIDYIDFTSEKSIIYRWLNRLESNAYLIGAGGKSHARLTLSELVVNDFEFVRDRLICGKSYPEGDTYENGTEKVSHDSIMDVIIENCKGNYPDDFVNDKVLTTLLIRFVHGMGYSAGFHDGHESW